MSLSARESGGNTGRCENSGSCFSTLTMCSKSFPSGKLLSYIQMMEKKILEASPVLQRGGGVSVDTSAS